MSVQHETAPAAETGARYLLAGGQFTAVSRTVRTNNPGMTADVADRIVAEALAFVAACSRPHSGGLRPSRTVDEGWHALILHTKVYAALCNRLGGFVHHVPEPPDPTRHDAGELDRTQQAIHAAGYRTDPLLWLPPTDVGIPVAASCEHSEGGGEGTCTESCSFSGPN
ncbi:glycine-rich domain-containing protein [Streptomyces qinglanensis]|uniref:glycine-rich domain-containing protein n=1 Tax=Streptomyces qinglanensis TaxID=943816 RepID=UPI003D750229